MKNIVILGSTGSVGKQTLDVLKKKKGYYRVFGLAAKDGVLELKKQIAEFKPEIISVANEEAKRELLELIRKPRPKIYLGETGLIKLSTDPRVDSVVVATSGNIALVPVIKAIQEKKRILIANKEILVMAGNLINKSLKKYKAEFLPLDTEHSAIFQCLKGENKNEIKNLILTCSGGPFRDYSREQLKNVTKKDVLTHPVWKMGPKISVDSATLMNKGLEAVEACCLFNIPLEKIKVVIHPQCIVHSMVEFIDGTIKALLSPPDMRFTIQYALFHPKRIPGFLKDLNLIKIRELSFYKPDFKRFPCLNLAISAGKTGGTMPAVLISADEIAVNKFLKGEIKFLDIPKIIQKALRKHKTILNPKIKDILEAESWTKKELNKI